MTNSGRVKVTHKENPKRKLIVDANKESIKRHRGD